MNPPFNPSIFQIPIKTQGFIESYFKGSIQDFKFNTMSPYFKDLIFNNGEYINYQYNGEKLKIIFGNFKKPIQISVCLLINNIWYVIIFNFINQQNPDPYFPYVPNQIIGDITLFPQINLIQTPLELPPGGFQNYQISGNQGQSYFNIIPELGIVQPLELDTVSNFQISMISIYESNIFYTTRMLHPVYSNFFNNVSLKNGTNNIFPIGPLPNLVFNCDIYYFKSGNLIKSYLNYDNFGNIQVNLNTCEISYNNKKKYDQIVVQFYCDLSNYEYNLGFFIVKLYASV